MATQTLLTHTKMISNLIGEFSPAEHPELYKAGFHYVADLIPVDNELWQSENLKARNVHQAGNTIRGGSDTAENPNASQEHLKIISVWSSPDGVNWIKCKEVNWEEFRKASNVNSLYYNNNAFENPVYSISDGGSLFVNPWHVVEGEAPGDFTGDASPPCRQYFRYWSYEPDDFFGINNDNNEPFESYKITADLFGFPRDAQLPAVIKSAMNILQIKMGNAVHEDEDSELLQLQQAQFAQLGQFFESEMSRLNIQYKKMGVEEE
jgi:hypothetical protein